MRAYWPRWILKNRLLQQLTQAINRKMYGSFRSGCEREEAIWPLRGLQVGVIPCKGILQARLRRHYKDFFAYVLRRNSSQKG